MPLAIVLIVLVVGSVVFHLVTPWYLTPLASNWSSIDDTISITFWVTGIVFVAVNLFLAYAIIKYRYNPKRRADYEPENSKLELWLTGVTAVGVAAMLAPGLFVWADFVTVPSDAKVFEAVGQQWQWMFRLPGEDQKFGTVETRFVDEANPFGMNPEDENGQDDVLIASNEIHLPIDVPVKALLRSKDVLHDFAVAQFRVKMDLVPGLVTYLWFTPTKVGEFEILCEELCGIGHHTMRGRVIVDEPEDYQAWLAGQPTFADTLARVPGDAVAGKQQFAICVTCHGANGEGNLVLNAPKVAGQSEWYLRRQIKYYKDGTRGTHDDDIYGKQMAPMAATLINDAAIENVIAYIQTLPDEPPEKTVTGDIKNGERLYVTCGNCHGRQGEGEFAVNAPRQAGMTDWYLVRQLQNFKKGVRGAHHDDLYGMQMISMAASLRDDQSINDVVAYINTLDPTPRAAESEVH